MSEFFKFDKEHYTYVEIKKNLNYYFRQIVSYLIFSTIAAVGLVYLFFWVYDAPETEALKKQNDELGLAADSFARTTAYMAMELDSLKQRNKAIHRKLLNADPIDEDSAELATQSEFHEHMDMEDLSSKVDQLDKKLDKSSQKQAAILDLAQKNKEELKRMPSIRPVASEVISGFGKRRHPISGQNKQHNGIDLKADIGAQVRATGDGVVSAAGTVKNGYGQYISINHSYGYVTVYANLSKISVRRGQKVKRGDVIGLSGNSGLSKGPHLHYEIQKDGQPVDPIDYFSTDLSPEVFKSYKEKAGQYNESMD